MKRQEHLEWCKQRAMEYVNKGDLQNAFASMASDIMKHPDTEHHQTTNLLGMKMLMIGELNTAEKMAKWIQGYN